MRMSWIGVLAVLSAATAAAALAPTTCRNHQAYACYDCPQVNSWTCFPDDDGPFQGCTLVSFEPNPPGCEGGTCWVSHTSTGPNCPP